ncbi:ATP-binding protein [Candidatus Halobeggiatoa sp. HSG11]|nr:ATP-binding protein [Candidatus Halobeggiatoa sp. HSG11]
MKHFVLNNVATNYNGFKELLRLKNALESAIKVDDKNFSLDISKITWFEGNMCACLGGLLAYFKSQGLTISINSDNSEVESYFRRNHFFHFLNLLKQDTTLKVDEETLNKLLKLVSSYENNTSYVEPFPSMNETTIEFKKYKINDLDDFQAYIKESFSLGSKGLPSMTKELLKHFRRSLLEIFLNSVEHADTQRDIFACGQFFPKKQQLDFCITDLGIGIKNNIKRKINLVLNPEEAINWAMQKANTTRKNESGGLGLKLIREFIERNNGRIIIVSDAGYWELKNKQITKKCFDCSFPGTVVLIEINTADTNSYALKSEINPNSIF